MEFQYVLIIVGIILALLLLYLGYTHFLRNKNLNDGLSSNIDINALINALGGEKNITNITSSPSKLTVTLQDHSLVSIEDIQALGASGIVEGKDNLSMIFGRQSAAIEADLKKYMN